MENTEDNRSKKIGIVGAGISGLMACKYALSKGFTPVVFEAGTAIGGVWTTPLETTRLQSPREMYRFMDHPWPDTEVVDDLPLHEEIIGYIRSYADRFGLAGCIRFNSRVVGIDYKLLEGSEEEMEGWHDWGGSGAAFNPAGKWELSVEDMAIGSTKVHEVDFLILAIGKFSGLPNFPEFPQEKGPEAFRGEVIHSMDHAAMDFRTAAAFIKGSRVAVVGFQKSAVDIAVECSMVNGSALPCTVVYRREYWHTPGHLPGFVAYLYLNRVSELLLHKPGEGLLYSFPATALYPLRWAISKFTEIYLRWKLPLSKLGMVPKHSYLQEISSCLITIMPKKFYQGVEEGSIILKKSQTIGFCKEGVLLDGETSPLEVDLVICATGFRGDAKLGQIFRSPAFHERMLGHGSEIVPLYRQCIHPRIPQLAVIGFAESLMNVYTYEMGCIWLSELLDGTFKLPSIKEMEKDIEGWEAFMRRYAGNSYRRSCLGALNIWYNDQLCKDMGWNPQRKKGLFAELFQPYGSLDYTNP